jgi:hypothetical protein
MDDIQLLQNFGEGQVLVAPDLLVWIVILSRHCAHLPAELRLFKEAANTGL